MTLPEIRRAARRALSREAGNVGAGGTETEATLRRNRRHIQSVDRMKRLTPALDVVA